MYPDLKILSRELRKVSREAKHEIKKAESNRKNSEKFYRSKFSIKIFTPSKIGLLLHARVHYGTHYDVIISGFSGFIM